MCGIFGGSAIDGKNLDHMKLMTLGMFNTARGVDSCGYYYSGNIQKGIANKANFSYLVADNKEKNNYLFKKGDLNCEVFLGHTRKSTHGTNSEENAHPHRVGNYIQTHNGIIKEIWQLCAKYKVNHTNIHVDSIGLAHIINQIGFEVLHEYKGYAALAMTWVDDPEHSLYLYHGESRETKDGALKEERPLFILRQPEGIYYSSIEASLNLINCDKEEFTVDELPRNIVYKFVKGKMTSYKYEVKREDNNIVYTIKNTTTTTYNTPPITTVKEPTKIITDLRSILNKDDMIYAEGFPPEYETFSKKIYFRNGRYLKYYNILLDGELFINKNGYIIPEGDTSDSKVEKFYFLNGIMMQDKRAYENALRFGKNNKLNIAALYSKYSKYPVFNLQLEALDISANQKYKWYKQGKMISKIWEFTPKFSSRRYQITNGKTTAITAIKLLTGV